MNDSERMMLSQAAVLESQSDSSSSESAKDSDFLSDVDLCEESSFSMDSIELDFSSEVGVKPDEAIPQILVIDDEFMNRIFFK